MSSELAELHRAPAERRQPRFVAAGRLGQAGVAAIVLLGPALLLYLSFNAGGYFPSAYGIAAVLLAQALLLRTVLAERPFEGFSRALAVPLCALALYAGWQLLSLLWAKADALALDSFDLTLVYLLTLTLFGSVRWRPSQLRWLLRAVFAAAAAVCVIGLVSRTLPHLWPTSRSFFADRLNYPLTYWNAEGMLAALALVFGFHLSADRSEPPAVRVIAAAALPAIAATLLLTFSRGALGVAAIGLLAYVLLTRPSLLPVALLASVPPVAIALAAAWGATGLATDHPTSAHAVAQGDHLAAVLGGCVLGAAALRALLLLADARMRRIGLVRHPPADRVGHFKARLLAPSSPPGSPRLTTSPTSSTPNIETRRSASSPRSRARSRKASRGLPTRRTSASSTSARALVARAADRPRARPGVCLAGSRVLHACRVVIIASSHHCMSRPRGAERPN